MPKLPLRVEAGAELSAGFAAIRSELGIVDGFAPAVEAQADEAARTGPAVAPVADRRDVPFVSIDPPGSRDLDQALSIERSSAGAGYVVRYAIADVAAFVAPGSQLDSAVHERGVTIYLPDEKAPLHPPVLSEGATSLLPGQDRQALVWRIELDGDGAMGAVHVERATVRNRRAYSYPEVEAAIEAGSAEEQLLLLRDVGRLRQAREAARGGVSLDAPEQVVVRAAGRFELAFRAPLASEGWNEQISLLTGMAAAKLMLDAGIGVLRTLPPPDDGTVARLRRRAGALGVPWPAALGYPGFIRSLHPLVPDHAALLRQAARLFRGAGYVAFDGNPPSGAGAVHAAVAAPYAHVTAPLRRLVDRFGNEVVLAVCAGVEVPEWARAALASLPDEMQTARHREGAANGMALDLVEAAVLAGRIGDVVRGIVVDVRDSHAQVQIRQPAIVTNVTAAGARLGDEVTLRVMGADPVTRKVTLDVVA
ncbi:MAG TPA: RNB domain-containing ribonuclease [Acidimicrobiales bacterium]|nr:RNB domain-containing ribonuclease [Acidimicrobiales bacterium]